MCVLYVNFGSKVRPRTFGCVAMGSALLFIIRSATLPSMQLRRFRPIFDIGNSHDSAFNRMATLLSPVDVVLHLTDSGGRVNKLQPLPDICPSNNNDTTPLI